MTAQDIKKLLYKESVGRWNTKIAVDEIQLFSGTSDFVMIDWNDQSREIEVKAAKYDLCNLEPKKRKWRSSVYMHSENYSPNFFYFCMPEDLYAQTAQFIYNTWKFAGVLIVQDSKIITAKKPKRIHHKRLIPLNMTLIARSLYWKRMRDMGIAYQT